MLKKVNYFGRLVNIISIEAQDGSIVITGEREIGLIDCEGHFPGLPTLPGVFSLGMAVKLIQAAMREVKRDVGLNLKIEKIDRCRFKEPVIPGDKLYFRCEILMEGKASILVTTDSGIALKGNVEFTLNNQIVTTHIANTEGIQGIPFQLCRTQIDKTLPHRPPMAHLDKADVLSAKYALGTKRIKEEEPFLVGQMLAPEIVPEALAQLGALTFLSQLGEEERSNKLILFAEIDVGLFGPVLVGDSLFLEVTLGPIRRSIGKAVVRANTASNGLVCEGTLTYAITDRQR